MIDLGLASAITDLIHDDLARAGRTPLVIGLCGAQGSGKSTLAAYLAAGLAAEGLRIATLSLDDLYKTRADRCLLARHVHPLLATRGVPGTHDIPLGCEVIATLERGDAAPLPRFDKAADDRVPPPQWPLAPPATQVLLLEGWCVGARPQPDVSMPVNALEAAEDRDAVWRKYVNTALSGDYQALFARLDRLVLLAAPGWEIVARWREQQEAALRSKGGPAVMSPAGVARFIQHYERLTRWILAEMPLRADLTARLGSGREVLALERRGGSVG
ncbi:MAG: kinase [Sphingomonadales bacterium]|nr:kinase [Sphingomonadales bacterium]